MAHHDCHNQKWLIKTQKKLRHAKFRAYSYGNSVTDDRWYLGPALSLRIRSKALTVEDKQPFNVCSKIFALTYVSEKLWVDFPRRRANLFFVFIGVHEANPFGCACLKGKWRDVTHSPRYPMAEIICTHWPDARWVDMQSNHYDYNAADPLWREICWLD